MYSIRLKLSVYIQIYARGYIIECVAVVDLTNDVMYTRNCIRILTHSAQGEYFNIIFPNDYYSSARVLCYEHTVILLPN